MTVVSVSACHIAEEASQSQSVCEMDDSTASAEKCSAAESELNATRDEEQSDESTDVEDAETSKLNTVHAGDGDKADGTCYLGQIVG